MTGSRRFPCPRIDVLNLDVSDMDYIKWDSTAQLRLPKQSGGSDEGRLFIRFLVDGQGEHVFADLGRTGDIAAIDRAIDTLTEIRNELSRLYDGRQHPGQCLTWGDLGRCNSDDEHPGACTFPKGAQ